jgi:hypothetical protein
MNLEIPVWIIALSQLFVDILIVVLLIVLIVAAISIARVIRRLGTKAEIILENVNDATEYVKESKVVGVLKKLFAPSTTATIKKKLFKNLGDDKAKSERNKRRKKKRNKDDESYSW